ncbi:hypothetical protein ACD591_11660 [Rufibacter glacialis]|uniref:TIGR02588 family protein n=1 Tax=Rufibacter glacialis TaxID=1259555 RepID=A0A5M8QS98_9BACT|nr:hypothetical protein [Rufibacter glacialis]KAA6437373.1 hypothetical protein FOE74_02415 [Rufibacter glacialis]GGK59810.1 hypothetical protein GCM10011405_04940 [Rufibacter glacialis]
MKKNPLEWFVFGLSVVLILALLGYLGVKAFHYQHTPPDLHVEIFPEKGRPQQNIHRVELTNRGEQTAENVLVEITLFHQGQEIDKAEVSFPIAPKESRQEAWITFKKPKQADQKMQVHVLGYNKP